MKTCKPLLMLLIFILFSMNQVKAQEANSGNFSETTEEVYLLERDLNDTSEENLQKIANSAQGLAEEIGPQVEWVHSYVTDKKMICVFKYENRNAMAEHAEKAGLKPGELKKVKSTIGPHTASSF